MNHYNRQQGGTVVGIIIGLVIGLSIALGVAVAINKTPIPFTNKVARLEKLEPTANQSSDPNRPLYGNKAAAKEAAKEFAKEPENTAVAQNAVKKPDVKSDGKVAVVELSNSEKAKKPEIKTADAKPDDVKSADGKTADARPEGKDASAKSDSADDKWTYFLQAGAFREPTDAENTRARLAMIGVEAKVSERQSENGTLYRVRVGPFAQMEAMNKVRGKLSDNGVDAAVVRIAK